MLPVFFDRLYADVQTGCDLLVGLTLGDQLMTSSSRDVQACLPS